MLVLLAVPFARVRASIPRDALRFPGVGFGVAINATWPVGVPVAPDPALTLLLTLTGVPCATLIEVTVRPLRLAASVVKEGRNAIEDQLFTRFWAFTEPRPVARSYPLPVLWPERIPY